MSAEMEKLAALAARCEQAGGPDRRLDYEIMAATVPVGGRYDWDPNDENHRYTELIDAALTLVPEGYDWMLGRTNNGLTIHAEVGGRGDQYMRFGETEALAMCASALLARARPTTTGESGL